jgi:beta-fructofuranosidase
MWECPDFFPVLLREKKGLDISLVGANLKHTMKVSLDLTRFEYYTIGTYNPKKDKYVPDDTSDDGWGGLRYDYGNYYASKSFFDDATNRRILMDVKSCVENNWLLAQEDCGRSGPTPIYIKWLCRS